MSTCLLLNRHDVGETTEKCCDDINYASRMLIAGVYETSAEAANPAQCNKTSTCYNTTVYALEQAEVQFEQENMVVPFIDGCYNIENPAVEPTPAPLLAIVDNPNSTLLEPACVPCSRLNGYTMLDDGFVNISTWLGLGYINDQSKACAAGFQCVPVDPYNALPEHENDFSKKDGCCQKCLNGQSCPAMTVAASGYYFDNLCPDGFKCEEGKWPKKCPPGLMCSKGVTVNCTVVVEMARDSEKIAWDDIEISNSTDSNSTNITKIPSGIFDGSYCPGESYLSWCPGGYYCPNPEEMYLCPEGYFCPPKSMKFEFKCSDSKCGPGATFNQPQVLVQIITASTVLLLTLLVGIIMIINDRLQKQYEASVFAQRRAENVQGDFLMEELMALRNKEGAVSIPTLPESPHSFNRKKTTWRGTVVSASFSKGMRRGSNAHNAVLAAAKRQNNGRSLTNSPKQEPKKLSNREIVKKFQSNLVTLESQRKSEDGHGGVSMEERSRVVQPEKRSMWGSLRNSFRNEAKKGQKVTPVGGNSGRERSGAGEIRLASPATSWEKKVRIKSGTNRFTLVGVAKALTGAHNDEDAPVRPPKRTANDIPTYEEIRIIFQSIDKDGDGLINFKELKATRLGRHLSDQELRMIINNGGTSQKGAKSFLPKSPGNSLRANPIDETNSPRDSKVDKDFVAQLAANMNNPEAGGINRHNSKGHKAPRRPSMNRRKSLDPTALLASLTGSDNTMLNKEGINFEDFATEFFKMMMKKKKNKANLATDPNVRGVQIEFKDMCLNINLGGKDFKVLDSVNGKIQEKTMVGLMGGSGAGKTSLLNALCGRAWYGKVTGEILVNGKQGNISDFKNFIGFVPQDDTVHGDLSVYENLMYSGRFRLPRSTHIEEIDDLAMQTLEDMQLIDVRDSLVGDVGKRGVSGGQRKRVNIGVELMAMPKVLFLDEPTSGLDANSSSVALEALRHLSRRGTTVIMVIHQPRYQIFKNFDKICLLAKGGKMVYEGLPGKVVDYFSELGYELPFGENPADWMLDISSGELKATKKKKGGIRFSGKDEVAGEKKIEKKLEGEDDDEDDDLGSSASSRIDFLEKTWREKVMERREGKKEGEDKYGGLDGDWKRMGLISQYLLFLERLFIQRARKFRMLCLDVLLIVGSAYLAAQIAGPYIPIDEDSEVIDVMAEVIINTTIPGAEQYDYPTPLLSSFTSSLEYSMIANLLFVVLVTLNSLRAFGDGKLLYWREGSSGYSTTSFFLAQITLDQVFQSIFALWAAIAGYELRTSLCPLASHIVLYQLTAWFSSGWGYVFSMIFPPSNVVMASCMFVCLCGTILSGSMTVLTHHDINDNEYLSLFVGATSSTRWFTEWMLVSDFKALPPQYGYTDPKLNYFEIVGFAFTDLKNASVQGEEGWYYNALPMVCIGFAMRVVTLALLHVKERRKMNKIGVDEMIRKFRVRDVLWLIFGIALPCTICIAACYMAILRKGPLEEG